MTWRPSAALSALHARAAFLAEIRAWFNKLGYLEVEVPAIALAPASDPWLDSFEVRSPVEQTPALYLLTSPESYLKRLLARDGQPIFTLARAYRAEPRGVIHNPEFTLLEWYQPHAGFAALCVRHCNDFRESSGLGSPRYKPIDRCLSRSMGVIHIR